MHTHIHTHTYTQIGFRDSFAVFSHKAVSGVLTSTDQPRGVYIGASPVPHKCMGNDKLTVHVCVHVCICTVYV